MEALIKQEAAYKQAEPADDIAIETAKSSFGDYKLKMSPQYQVSEKDRVNAEKKRQQMVLLESSIYSL